MTSVEYDCPYTRFKKKCSEVRNGCPKWIHILGTDPNNKQPVDVFDCADRWSVKMQIEIAKEVRQGAAATEGFRNIMVRLAAGQRPEQIMNEEMKLLNGS